MAENTNKPNPSTPAPSKEESLTVSNVATHTVNTNNNSPAKEESITVSNAIPQETPSNNQDNDIPAPKSNKDLTIEEIDSKLRGGSLMIEEVIALQEQRDLLISEETGATKRKTDTAVQNKPGKGAVEERDIDKIKEDDIINYMYNEWLLASANYGLKKGFLGIDKVIDKIERHAIFSNRVVSGNIDHATPKLTKKFEDIFKKDVETSKNAEYSGNFIRETAEHVRNKEFDKIDGLKPETRAMLQGLNDQQIERFYGSEHTEKTIKAFSEMDRRVQVLAGTYAAAQILNKQAQGTLDTSPSGDLSVAFQKEKEQAMLNTYKWIDTQISLGSSEADHERFYAKFENMTNMAQQGYVKAGNEIAAGRYKDNNDPSKPYRKPEEITNLENIFLEARSGNPMGMYEAVNNNRSKDTYLQAQLALGSTNSNSSDASLQHYNERRSAAAQRIIEARRQSGIGPSPNFEGASYLPDESPAPRRAAPFNPNFNRQGR